MNSAFSVLQIEQIQEETRREPWLIDALWTRSAAGILGGPPKCCKSWLGLDMAVSVASATPCLDHFPVPQPGPALIYMAEDALHAVRQRIQGICAHRRIDLAGLELFAIDTPSLRLDSPDDQKRLTLAIREFRPRMLLLDPLVRLHGLDENSSLEMSRLLAFLRELQRAFDMAVVLVHHTSKKARGHAGQALRGSSDLHAWTDSSLYLTRKHSALMLTIEHRTASAPDPILLELLTNPTNNETHLKVADAPPGPDQPPQPDDLALSVTALIRQSDGPLTRSKIRERLKVRNQSLGPALTALETAGQIRRTNAGWIPCSEQNTPGGHEPERQILTGFNHPSDENPASLW